MARSLEAILLIFRRHYDTLREQQKEATRLIDNWCKELIRQIGDHACKEKYLLDEAYEMHRKHLEDLRDQFIQTNSIAERNNDFTEIQRLREKCDTLKIALVELKTVSQKSEYIKVSSVELLQLNSQDQPTASKTEDQNLENLSIRNDGFKSMHDTQSDSTIAASNYVDQPLTYGNNQTVKKSDATNNEKSIAKCPICFMIFPATMSDDGRSLHVNEHLNNE